MSVPEEKDGGLKSGIETKSLPSFALVNLNVGGTKFTTTVGTLLQEKESFFVGLLKNTSFVVNSNLLTRGVDVFIDRDGTHFRHILNYLRQPGTWCLSQLGLARGELEQLKVEAEFYQLAGFLKHFDGFDVIWLSLYYDSDNSNRDAVAWWLSRGFELHALVDKTEKHAADDCYFFSSCIWDSETFKLLSSYCQEGDSFYACSASGRKAWMD